MAGTLWCQIDDPETNLPHTVGHPFPDTDPNSQHFSRTGTEKVRTGNSYGTPTYQDREVVTLEMDICGYHWEKQNPFQPTVPPLEVEAETVDNRTEEYLKGYKQGRIEAEQDLY